MGRRQGAPDSDRQAHLRALEAQHVDGTFDFLFDIEEIGHHMVILGYIPYVHRNPSILDVGCGQGRLVELLRTVPHRRYLGIDASPSAVRDAARRGGRRDRFEVADYEDWEPPGRYDVILFNESIYYSHQPQAVLRRYARALAPGGALIVSVFRYLSNERVWSEIEGDYTVLAADVVENSRGQAWEVRALQPTFSADGASQ